MGFLNRKLDFRALLSKLKIRTLVVEDANTNVPLNATEEWVRALPHARLLLIPDAGHELFLDQTAAFLTAAEAFMRGRQHH